MERKQRDRVHLPVKEEAGILTLLALAGISSFDYYLDLKNLRNSEDNPFEGHLAVVWWSHTNALERQHEPEIQM